MRPTQKWLRRLAWWSAGTLVVFAGVWGAMILLMWHWVAQPPPLPPEAATAPTTVERRGDRVYFGRSWFGQREGLPVLYLTGTAYEMGLANGVLTQKLIHLQEESVLTLLDRYVPQKGLQFLIKFFLVYKNRHLASHVLPEHQLEILGLSRGCPDLHPSVGPYYHRLLNYHGAQDISYMMMHSPLIRRGCTSFGAWGPITQSGHLLTARNFDWEADPVFDQDRIVIICEPKDGLAFVSLAWAGMAGCVSGMNRAGVSVTVNGAPSRLPGDAATPTCLVAREVLQHARTLAEAIEIIRHRKVFVSALFLVGCKTDGRFVVIEKTPEQMAVREPSDQPYLICANHYLTSELASDALNLQFERQDTSLPRFERMTTLLTNATRPLTPEHCAGILRDRCLSDGRFPGNGHRSTLNPLIATHAVIMDLTEGIFWASKPPHQLGQFIAFDVNQLDLALPERSIPEDPLLTNGGYSQYQVAREKLEEGWQALKQHDLRRATDCVRIAEQNNPGFYRNSWLLSEVLLRQGQTNLAAVSCAGALAGQPALGVERGRLSTLARQLGVVEGQRGK